MSNLHREPSSARPTLIRRSAHAAIFLLTLLLLPIAATLTGCGGASTTNPTAVAVSGPSSLTLDPGNSASFIATVTGGPLDAGVLWSLTGCSATPCGTLSNSTTASVTYTAPTTVATAFTVTLTASAFADSAVTATVRLNVSAGLAINPAAGALPAATFEAPYTEALKATGGLPPYTWSISQGALPAGLYLSTTTGAITGTPTSRATATFTVKLTDSGSPTQTATSAFTLTPTIPVGTFEGQVLSGTTPVRNATLQLYASGATGNASAATPMLTQAVLTNSQGMFQLGGSFMCGQSSTGQAISSTAQLYLVATGGTTSTTSNTSNPALTMVTAIGPCTNFGTSSFDTINEFTTAAAAWALAPFTVSITNIGTTATNTLGLTNAFLDAALLADPITGNAATLPTNLTVETGKLAALADALNTCTTGPGSGCTALFTAATPASSPTPTDTFAAALSIVRNPGQNVAAVFATIPATPPFATTLTASPNDWTMSLTVTGGGLNAPTALGIDTRNNVWVANQAGPLSAFNAQGTPLSTTGFGAGSIDQTYGLAIDTSNNVWVTNYNGGSGGGGVTEVFGVNTPATLGTIASYSNSICYPTAAAADTNGDIFIANEECSSATVLSSSGTVVSPFLGESLGLQAKPYFLAVDTAHGFWLSDNDDTISHISAPSIAYPDGQLLAHPTCCYKSNGLVTDALGNVWVTNYLNSSFSEVGPDGTVLINQQTLSNGTATPYAAAIDAAQNLWFTSLDSSTILELSGSSSAKPGTELSPSIGVHNHGGFGYDSSLIEPYSLAPDRSGNLWVTDNGQNSLVMFFGLATPTSTPLQPIPTPPQDPR